MAYTPREIKDRIAEGDDIFQVEDLGDNRIRLIPSPTHVWEPGTPVNKGLLQHMEDHLVPPGGIIMWSGAINDIPVGWALCDGSNGTPDLRNRFIVGAGGTYNVGSTGGANRVTLTISEMPSHDHGSGSLSTSTDGSHSHTYSRPAFSESVGAGSGPSSYQGVITEYTSSAGSHSHSVTGTTSSRGDGLSHENRPPYYALCFIMKL